MADIRVTEASADRILRLIPKEPAELSKAVDGTSAEVKATRASFGDDVDVEVVEAIVAIEVAPFERYLRRIAFNPNIRPSFHWARSIRGSDIPMVGETSPIPRFDP